MFILVVFLFFCTVKLCANGFAIKSIKKIFYVVGQGKVRSCARYTRLQFCLCAARWRHHGMLKIKTQSMLDCWVSPFRGVMVHRSRWNWCLWALHRFISHSKFHHNRRREVGVGARKIQNSVKFSWCRLPINVKVGTGERNQGTPLHTKFPLIGEGVSLNLKTWGV